jgi:hypothetical protein
MRITKTLGFAGALLISALVGGTLIGSALATDEKTDTDSGSGASTPYCDVFRETLAAELGVTTDELTSAGKAAAIAAIDAAVAAGDLDDERAASMKERIEAAEGDACGWFGKGFALGFGRGAEHGLEHGMARGFMSASLLGSAADALGLDASALREAIVEAESLEAIATEQGVAYDDVKAAILADVQAGLDEAVANGLDQERADTAVQRVTAWLDEGGQLEEVGVPGFGPARGHRPGGGHWGTDDDADAEESGA